MSLLGKAYGLDDERCDLLEEVGSLHDIGKIGIPTQILEKKSPLTVLERRLVEMHPMIGFNLIKNLDHPEAKIAGAIILTHHENQDGTGYPNGLQGYEIPLEGAICSICDVYDALRTRPYVDKKRTHDEIIEMMYDRGSKGLYHKFRPDLMSAFKELFPDIKELYQNEHPTL